MNELANKGPNTEEFLPYLIDDEPNCYYCECRSCKAGTQLRDWPSRAFLAGFFLPLLWLFNLSIYVYTQWCLNHEPTHLQIPQEELPSTHEFESKTKASHLKLDKSTVDEIDRVNETTTVLDENPETSDCPSYNLHDYRSQFLRGIASDILESHTKKRAYYRKWTQWTLLGIVTYAVIAAVVAVGCRPIQPS